jgi:transcriptional regulator with XRE-family HTH domain
MEVHARAFRARSGLTQVVLALYSDCALETLRKLERGDVEGMRLETVMRIAAALGVRPSDLVPALGTVNTEGVCLSNVRSSSIASARRRVQDLTARLVGKGRTAGQKTAIRP